MEFEPHPHQKKIIDSICNKKRINVWSGMGTGKTASTATALHELSAYPALIVAPKNVALNTWPSEYKKWDHLTGVRVGAVVGSPSQRLKVLKEDHHVYTINYENLDWLWGTGKTFKTIVADESTKLKSFRPDEFSRARFLAHLTCKAKRHINLTGTPTPNGMIDLWGQNWFIDQGKRLCKTFDDYTQCYFDTIYYKNSRGVKYNLSNGAEFEILEKLKDVTVSIEGLCVDKPIVNVIDVDLPKKARDVYDEVKEHLTLKAKGIKVKGNAVKVSKLLQISSGFMYHNDSVIDLHSEKVEALKSVVNEASGMPVLVAYWWKQDVDKIKKVFPKAVVLDGKPQTIDRWNKGNIQMLLAHPQSCGHGLNLQYGGNILVFYSDWWNLEAHLQIIERIGPMRQKQAGLNRSVFIHHIHCKNTFDSVVYESHSGKKSIQDLALDYFK